MKRLGSRIIMLLLLGIVAPGLLMRYLINQIPQQTVEKQSEQQAPVGEIFVQISEDKIVQMELNAYVTAVVLAEMPADFEIEALKAQAVVARTYALRRCSLGDKHGTGVVCAHSACCQAFCTPEEFLDRGGTEAQLEKMENAVIDTARQVLTYDGNLIEATFFSCSGGSTEDAVAVWGSDVPYLQATDSPGEERAASYLQTVKFSVEEFANLLGVAPASLEGAFVGPVTYTRGGGVDTMTLGGTTYTGTWLRQTLGLNSTAFWLTAIGDSVTITVRGHGHRVGMSQYGADAMARQGSDYRTILAHYYQGTQLVQWTG